MKTGRVYYTVLNMGLGHAARSTPIIKKFVRQNWQVLIGSNGRALQFLRREFPGLDFVVTPDYGITYTQSNWLLLKLLLQTPAILQKIHAEHQFTDRVVKTFSPDIIFGDHCYGAYHAHVPSFFISHQIYFAVPRRFQAFRSIPAQFNLLFHRKFNRILIPDQQDNETGLLSGSLSQVKKYDVKYDYIGILSSLKKTAEAADIDILFSISGPEPQRTIFEKIILTQVEDIPGKKVVLLGKSEESKLVDSKEDCVIYTHLPRMEIQKLYNRAKLIVSRPGYSTLMELAELGKKALFIPTPGQTEQLYLAGYVRKKGWFYSVRQKELRLTQTIAGAEKYPGLFLPEATQKSVDTIWRDIVDAV